MLQAVFFYFSVDIIIPVVIMVTVLVGVIAIIVSIVLIKKIKKSDSAHELEKNLINFA